MTPALPDIEPGLSRSHSPMPLTILMHRRPMSEKKKASKPLDTIAKVLIPHAVNRKGTVQRPLYISAACASASFSLNQRVVGSIPTSPTNLFNALHAKFWKPLDIRRTRLLDSCSRAPHFKLRNRVPGNDRIAWQIVFEDLRHRLD